MSIKSYKGMDKDMKCRGFQYEPGGTYEADRAVRCGGPGFHACEIPLDVFNYYPPSDGNRFFEVEQDGELSRDNEDSKVASSVLKIGAEIGIPGLVKAHVEWVKEQIQEEKTGSNTGYRSAATNIGYQSAATNTGYRSAATNTGDCSAATNTGNCSAATNTGKRSAATNTGNCSAATNTGYQSAATNTGNRSAATNTGNCSAATNTGDCSAAEVSGKDSVAAVFGYEGRAKGALGCAIVVAERGDWNGETYPLISIKAAIVDGETIKPDVWYTLKGGEFVEVEEDADD